MLPDRLHSERVRVAGEYVALLTRLAAQRPSDALFDRAERALAHLAATERRQRLAERQAAFYRSADLDLLRMGAT